jgi:sulfate permease, SulP family
MRHSYGLRRDECWVALATAIVVIVVGVEQGIILAVVLSPILHVKRHFTPNFDANAERLSEEVMGLVNVPDPPRWFVLCAAAIDDIDYTGAQTLLELADRLRERGIVFAVAEADDHVRRQLDRFGLTDKIGPDRSFDSLHETRAAFHAA